MTEQPNPEILARIAELLLRAAEGADTETELQNRLRASACLIIEYLLNPTCTINGKVEFSDYAKKVLEGK